MGTVRAIFNETTKTLIELGGIYSLTIKDLRKIQCSNLRYCLQDNKLYLPAFRENINKDRFAWVRIDPLDFEEYPDYFAFDKPVKFDLIELIKKGAKAGTIYSKRHKEISEKRIAVTNFIGNLLYDKIASNANELRTASKNDFESIAAEVFARKGFEVDLFRPSKDDGIDFLAIKGDDLENRIYCVQCKHPDTIEKKIPVATVREIFGVANAFDIHNCMVVTSTGFTKGAKEFAALKEDRIKLIDGLLLTKWMSKYKWESDE